MPRGYGEGNAADRETTVGRRAARRTFGGDGRRVDLRARAGGAEPGPQRAQVFSAGGVVLNMMTEPVGERVSVEFKLDGKPVTGYAGETIIETADRLGIDIPRLCYKPGMRPDGNCRACVVEIKGERVLAPSCCRAAQPGMEIQTASARARA